MQPGQCGSQAQRKCFKALRKVCCHSDPPEVSAGPPFCCEHESRRSRLILEEKDLKGQLTSTVASQLRWRRHAHTLLYLTEGKEKKTENQATIMQPDTHMHTF